MDDSTNSAKEQQPNDNADDDTIGKRKAIQDLLEQEEPKAKAQRKGPLITELN